MKHLSEEMSGNDPFSLFGEWYGNNAGSGLPYPDAFTLATASREGFVSARTVLLKGFDDSGFVFFTNKKSRKGLQILENNRVSMLFYWPHSGRQVRIEGKAKEIPSEESDEYFRSRPRESRIGAWASKQSRVIASRGFLEEKYREYSEQYDGSDIPRPEYWGGYRIVPDWFEFWQEGEHRLHDRITFSRSGKGWKRERLSP